MFVQQDRAKRDCGEPGASRYLWRKKAVVVTLRSASIFDKGWLVVDWAFSA